MYSNISWIELNGKVHYITYKDLKTERGKELMNRLRRNLGTYDTDNDIYFDRDSIVWYHILKNKGEYKDESDFSSPDNFPQEIVEAIKHGEFKLVTLCPDILNLEARIAYSKDLIKLYTEHKLVVGPAEIRYEYYTDELSKESPETYRKLSKDAYAEFLNIRMKSERKLAEQEQDLFWSTAINPANRKDVWK